MIQLLIKPYLQVFDYRSKSSIKEFWTFFIGVYLILILLGIVGNRIGVENLRIYFAALSFLPLVALGFRRLNEVGINKWLFVIPIAGLYLAGLPAKGQELR
ncbi:DUF805 domain-containing protein [Sphingobacterium sp. DK4209]|uniref:DUF805 domain-containing protein n=1 Tax=Sphingobacterium zhuxiongii TaxID=2662364 RepID=A0A5Q0QE99_9SPHI|nr:MULTISPECIES: DUF805 domain-containing protein [unclassified Sphingobacterium]MVZ64522.1 DUF805 domain-containing protein [Sphingobacterium sp. DK4209]QGA25852.1 DUF805 domain-containing protein [Sphingobacterium sp. dk4302]